MAVVMQCMVLEIGKYIVEENKEESYDRTIDIDFHSTYGVWVNFLCT